MVLNSCLLNIFLALAVLASTTEPLFWTLALVLAPAAVVLSQEEAGRSKADDSTTYTCSHDVLAAETEGGQHADSVTGPSHLPTLPAGTALYAAPSLQDIQQQLPPIRLGSGGSELPDGVLSPPSNCRVFVSHHHKGSFSRCLQRTDSPRGVWELPVDGELSPQMSTGSELWSQSSAPSPLASSASSPRQLSPQSTMRAPRFVITSRQVSMERQRPEKAADEVPLALPSAAGSPLAARVASGKWAPASCPGSTATCSSSATVPPVSTGVADVIAFFEARLWTA